ncbi:MAG: hypothetical protein ACYS0G_08060 [Planctomycetota bacterium]|jgi:hypothetical protein
MLETVRSRLLYRSLDAVVTASLRPRRELAAHLRSVLSPRSSNYDRVGSLVNALDVIAPGIARRASNLIRRPIQLPFCAQSIEPLAYGSGATVFLVEGGPRRRVLKIYRQSLGAGGQRLGALVTMYRGKYETIRSWYEGLPNLVWPAEFLVVPGPILGRPAVACVQDYIGEDARDFFRGFSDGELAAVLGASDELRRQFLLFAGRTLDVYRSRRLCADFLGEKNLAIVDNGGGCRLRLIDYGVFDLDAADRRTPIIQGRIRECIDRIRALAQHLAAADRAGGDGAG